MTDEKNEKKRLAGRARWRGVSPEDRKVLVSQAAHARWRDRADTIRVAEYRGEINLANSVLQCAVLDDGTRVLSERSVSTALEHQRHPEDYDRKAAAAASGAPVLPVFVSPSIANFLPESTRTKLANPVRYQLTRGFGIPAIGVEATLLADICEAFLAAREAGALAFEEQNKARAADRLMRALARVGLVALIDEATGFQVARDRDELQRLLEKYVSEEHRPWIKTFPDEFYVELFRLRGLKTTDVRKRPLYFGKLTNNLVYNRILPGMLPRLDDVNPANAQGRRVRKHHQHLQEQGEEHLAKHLAGLVYLMRSSASWRDFIRALDRAAPLQVEDHSDDTT